MSVSLGEILAHPALAAAEPVVHPLGTDTSAQPVRWVHSSEVLDIAPLLRGGELLLCGGITLATATPARRGDYVRELAQRGIAALAIETGGVLPEVPADMLETAAEFGLPVVELRKVVPFVGVMQAINSILVSESAGHLHQADAATRAMAAELAHGASLDKILGVLAGITGSAVRLVSPWGVDLGSALPEGLDAADREAVHDAGTDGGRTADGGAGGGSEGHGSGATHDGGADSGAAGDAVGTHHVTDPVGAGEAAETPDLRDAPAAPDAPTGTVMSVDIPVRGVLMGRLEVLVPHGGDAALAQVAGERAVDILGLALLQHTPPGLHAQAGAELMRAVLTSAPEWRLEQLAPGAGFPLDSPLVVAAVHAASPQELRGAIEAFLGAGRIPSAAYLDDAELVVMAGLPCADTARVRRELLASLQGLEGNHDAVISVGPLVDGVADAAWSLAEARRALDVRQVRRRNASPRRRPPAHGLVVLDADDAAVESLALTGLAASAREAFVNHQLRAVLQHDAQRQSQLMETLQVWLDSGCNTAQSARELHLERQSMHHRLQRIFDLCGGDPRGTGRLAALHLAVRMAGLP
ncbi:transcriptional regulator, CdaR [Pseudarthrobacter chlorophenolicus A6]|uniref:Transcriptional regulator, CdaR n=1 Tax=Pseudarthrobacter chlorophenolicus (strain ATCC 700700 / DSM 12829 / CIP 107037 / JCM 12360 / KCTC 9906 / NCIMB 13794 / A6) TaxID=452863 RepID=B8HGJ2_PSECP|nr:PucR family transcriptional regulator [Pseudarthrobacter chlorophenolicus]ACL41258.1 transcriptional regulator, CdaR [Pseudarthrobacter chlorophenolicus A6]SDQ67481.1 transcriptional regulator, CdaR family [Pseudarthrobacter chlorophenolicus]